MKMKLNKSKAKKRHQAAWRRKSGVAKNQASGGGDWRNKSKNQSIIEENRHRNRRKNGNGSAAWRENDVKQKAATWQPSKRAAAAAEGGIVTARK